MEKASTHAISSLVTENLVNECASFAKNYSSGQFFNDLALFLADKTGVEFVLIGHLENGQVNKVNTLALYAHGKLVDNMSYTLAGTPCENVMGRNCCYYPSGVQQMFPEDKELQDLNIDSYIGVPLFDSNKNPLGIIVLMHSRKITGAALIEKALSAVIPRTEMELMKVISS